MEISDNCVRVVNQQQLAELDARIDAETNNYRKLLLITQRDVIASIIEERSVPVLPELDNLPVLAQLQDKLLHATTEDEKSLIQFQLATIEYFYGLRPELPTLNGVTVTTSAPEELEAKPSSSKGQYYQLQALQANPLSNIALPYIKEQFQREGYFITDHNLQMLYTAINIGQPIIAEGIPGSGKSTLATEVCKLIGLTPSDPNHLIEVGCTSDIGKHNVLYEWNDAKRLTDLQFATAYASKLAPDEFNAHVASLESRAYSYDYLLLHALLKAVCLPYRSVVLIDEVDKAYPEFDTLLLDILDKNSFIVPECGRVGRPNTPTNQRPIFILTSNGNRELSAPLRRRAAYLHFNFLPEAIEAQVFMRKANVTQDEAEIVALFFKNIREDSRLNLLHPPTTAEGVTLSRALKATQQEISEKTILLHYGYWLKNRNDIERVMQVMGDRLAAAAKSIK